MQSAAAPHTMWVGTSSRSVASIAAWCAGKLQIYLLLCLNSISTLCLLLLLDSLAQVPHCQPVAYPCFIPPNPTHAPMHRCLFLTPPPPPPAPAPQPHLHTPSCRHAASRLAASGTATQQYHHQQQAAVVNPLCLHPPPQLSVHGAPLLTAIS